ncbi:3-hydroxyisobutyrate dehydrogenase [Dysgonomonas sp. PH5-45]|uniref:NAD(P)-dependent oxidoreductase n=1 Tax=unclassified Dysgonomonas TaxID=2630389 RepID=UPI00247724F7|nr:MULTISPECIES: NAD(P)-dependent oxidoreductase [unclassified Dysgonomonas]MDH6355656.1 3-hydroxyisobutyrate dehydrogenase [Dysgonomonas sp. PH5-45]MDH6388561.1 3-hydroxyisobutyrate dehydrogenase [Dysgonomonas sp. PH5-37]
MNNTTSNRIGWIGLGNMGAPMALNLLKEGYFVSVYNRSADKAKPLADAGARVYESVRELNENADIIFLMISDDKAVESVFSNLFKHGVEGKLFVNMSTISPQLACTLGVQCREFGAQYLDAPVSGSVKPATDGTLLILVGGRSADYDRVTPFFEPMGKLSLLLGEVGQGSKAKLAINYYMSVVVEGLAETVLFAEKHGIDRETMMLIVNQSACGSPMSVMKTPSVLKNNFPAAFPLKYMLKDIRLAQDAGLDTPTADVMEKIYAKASENGLADDDLMAVIKAL